MPISCQYFHIISFTHNSREILSLLWIILCSSFYWTYQIFEILQIFWDSELDLDLCSLHNTHTQIPSAHRPTDKPGKSAHSLPFRFKTIWGQRSLVSEITFLDMSLQIHFPYKCTQLIVNSYKLTGLSKQYAHSSLYTLSPALGILILSRNSCNLEAAILVSNLEWSSRLLRDYEYAIRTYDVRIHFSRCWLVGLLFNWKIKIVSCIFLKLGSR